MRAGEEGTQESRARAPRFIWGDLAPKRSCDGRITTIVPERGVRSPDNTFSRPIICPLNVSHVLIKDSYR